MTSPVRERRRYVVGVAELDVVVVLGGTVVDVVVVDGAVVDVVEPGVVVVLVVSPVPVVVVVVVDGDDGWLTRPNGPLSPGPGCGVLKGLVGRPGWLTPSASTMAKAAAPAASVPRDPIATGRARAAMRSRLDSVRRRSSSSGVRCSCSSSHDIIGAEA
jgi:hypothetical protein